LPDTLNEEVQTISGQLLLLLSKLGDPPEDFYGASAFNSLVAMKGELKEMNSEINLSDATTTKLVKHNERHTKKLELLQNILTKVQSTAVGVSKNDLLAMRGDLLRQVRDAMKPFIQLVAKTSSARSDPGGLLVKRLANLKRGVVELRATKMDVVTGRRTSVPMAATPPTNTGPTLSWALQRPAVPIIAQASSGLGGGNVTTVLSQHIAMLERKVANLKGQLGGEAINIGGAEFKSMTDAGAWLKAQAPQDGNYAYFLDAHRLMTLANGKGATTQEVLKMAEYKEKLKYSSIDGALIASGFQIAIPEFFGFRTTDKSAKALPGLSKSKDWDAKEGDRGLRYDIT
jgi:hypothetical protein